METSLSLSNRLTTSGVGGGGGGGVGWVGGSGGVGWVGGGGVIFIKSKMKVLLKICQQVIQGCGEMPDGSAQTHSEPGALKFSC